ncbi:hypothetical protein [Pseudarthrobacter sp. H2]|uniref:hypothetical protein n=1 Tax=Pseudarthrobacter sp. H2 TaxID=3418415 RepID=UPI003CF7BCEA
MNHKLRVLVRADTDPGRVTLKVAGCLTRPDFPALLHILKRAGRLAAGTEVSIDLHGASHLDPEVLLELREIAGSGTGQLRITLDEPASLPLCLLHVGSDGEVLALLDDEMSGSLPEAGPGEAPSPMPSEPETVDGLSLAGCFDGSLDPVATVGALSDAALCQLADALYRHLDTSSPSYGAHTWYELAAEELQNRRRTEPDGPAEGERAAGQSLG